MALSGGAGDGGTGAFDGFRVKARMNGLLAGLRMECSEINPYGKRNPYIDTGTRQQISSVTMSAGTGWTRYLVFTRPSRVQVDQFGAYASYALPVLAIGSTVIVSCSNNGQNDTLTLFPGTGSASVISSTRPQRFTHAVTLRNTAGSGVDVWLDGVQVLTGVTNPYSSLAGTLNVLGNGTVSASCDFHELAMWERALSSGDMTTLLGSTSSVLNRWRSTALGTRLGTRQGYAVTICAQSNGGFIAQGIGLYACRVIQYYLGACAVFLLGGQVGQARAGNTITGGQGFFLADPSHWFSSVTGSPSTWTLGTYGTGVQAWGADVVSKPDLTNDTTFALYIPWTENDSGDVAFATKEQYKTIYREAAGRVRGYLGRNAANMPVMAIVDWPFGGTQATDAGGTGQPLREAVAEMAANAEGTYIVTKQLSDSMPQGAALAGDGTFTGGDTLHSDVPSDNLAAARSGAGMAAVLMGLGLGEGVTSIPAGVAYLGGPSIASALLESSTSVLVTIAHDGGTDISLPLQAANGIGWAVMDGGSTAAPGTLRYASAAVRVNATQIRLTLTSSVTNAASACRLFYPYGHQRFGPGEAVYDNWSSVSKPAGWNITADLGAAYAPNQALQTPPSGIVMAVSTATLIQSFVLENYAAVASPGFAQRGLPFVQGDVPAGSSVWIRRGESAVPANFGGRTTWSDGSLKFCVFYMRDTNFASGESRTYDVMTLPGTAFNDTGTKTLADITGVTNLRMEYTNVTETGDTGPATVVGSGFLTAAFNTHAAVATRVEKHTSGVVCEAWHVWGMAGADPHLKVNWYVNLWKNADGSTYAVDVGAVSAQDWWSIAGKKRRDYNAALMNGATTIVSYTAVAHPYTTLWIACEKGTSNNRRGLAPWVLGAPPTLNYKPDASGYWVRTKLIPPYDFRRLPDSNTLTGSILDYIPGAASYHRANMPGTGGYMGRGIYPNSDVVALFLQTAPDWAIARTGSLDGLHAGGFSRRSNNLRTKPGDVAADTANTVISVEMSIDGRTVAPYDFTAQGMPAPVQAFTVGNTLDGYTVHEGGNGVWSPDNSAHLPNFCTLMYLVEGTRWHMEQLQTFASSTIVNQRDNIYEGNPELLSYNQAGIRATMSVPATTYRCMAQVNGERGMGFVVNVLGCAAALTPDNHPASAFWKRYILHLGVYMADNLTYLPDDMKAAGRWIDYWGDNSPGDDATYGGNSSSPWMLGMSSQCMSHAAAITGNAGIRDYARMLSNNSIAAFIAGSYLTHSYRTTFTTKRQQRSATHLYGTRPFFLDVLRGSLNAGTDRITWEFLIFNMAPSAGDILYLGAGRTAELPPGTPAYVVNVTGTGLGSSCQVSLTPGGTPVNFADRGNVITSIEYRGITFNGYYATTAAPHGFVAGETVVVLISGMTPSAFNGYYNAVASGPSEMQLYGGLRAGAVSSTGGGAYAQQLSFEGQLAWFDAYPIATDPPGLASGDGYPDIHAAAVVMANRDGHAAATNAITDKAQLFNSPVVLGGSQNWKTWRMRRAGGL